jgi:hypothetical protein
VNGTLVAWNFKLLTASNTGPGGQVEVVAAKTQAPDPSSGASRTSRVRATSAY